jgi:hypothetical protein
MPHRSLLAVLALIVAGCGAPAAATDTVASSTMATLADTMDTTPPAVSEEMVTELAVFLAAVDEGLADTEYAGAAFEDPEGFIGTAALFCDLLDDGLTPEEVLRVYVAVLEPEVGDVSPDDLKLGGVILGAGIEVLCPGHAAELGGGS